MKLQLKIFSKVGLSKQAMLLGALVLFYHQSILSQTNPTQISNIFKGKLVGLAFNDGAKTFPTEKLINFNCSSCTTVGNAYLFCVEINAGVDPNSTVIGNYKVNDIDYFFSSSTRVGVRKEVNTNNVPAFIHFQQIKFNCINQNFIKFNIPDQDSQHAFLGFFLVFECLDANSQEVSYSLILNDNTKNPDINITSASPVFLNPINYSKDVGFSIVGSTFSYMNGDASLVKINNNPLGLIGGSDLSSDGYLGAGATGHFKYENGILVGLDDDTEDNFMNGTDALAEVSNYLNGINSVNFSVVHENLGERSNYAVATIFSYTTTCQEFPVTVSNDTTICRNSPLQLSATGGTQYRWQPATDLSCSTCPNPIFTGDSSRFYTVRIWNNDSCSVVRPVKVNVTQLPKFSSITTSASACEGATGKILASSSLTGETYAINGSTPQATGNFFNLAPGFYTVTLQALNGCSKDSIVEVGSVISTNAYFTANPAQGAPPLWVNFSNQSTNASNYEWFLNGVSQGNNYNSALFDTTGNYNIELIAWPNNPACADTFNLNIHVFDSLIVQIPNVFTPNNDGKNDIFGINTNLPVTVEYQLFNRWGNEMISSTVNNSTSSATSAYFTPLWNGKDATDGVYFYKMKIKAISEEKIWEENMEGFFEVRR